VKRTIFLLAAGLLNLAMTIDAASAMPVGKNTWRVAPGGRATETTISGGPWTLGQGPNTVTLPSVGYCKNGLPQRNDGTQVMRPYYFPFTIGQGKDLQGYFDYRPKDSNEAIVAASSKDGGLTWKFQQQVLELNPGLCPKDETKTNAQTYPRSATADGLNSANDAGLGHPYVMDLKHQRFLYTLDRTTGHVNVDGLLVNHLKPTATKPLSPTSPTFKTDLPHTTGLLNPDGIISEVPGSFPRTVMYLQKQKAADNKGATAFATNQICASPPAGSDQFGKSANHDIVTPRLASTSDGVNFTDLGPVTGLNDSKAVSWTRTRYIGPRGTLVQLPRGRYGLFFSGGNCLDADSDAFHYIGYAESSNLRNWTIINGIDNPIASVKQITVVSNDVDTTDKSIQIPANAPLVATQESFLQRIYSPSATLLDNNQISLVFAGYKVKGPASNFSNYRTIDRVILKSTLPLVGNKGREPMRNERHEDRFER
jgi:hypothetical protein